MLLRDPSRGTCPAIISMHCAACAAGGFVFVQAEDGIRDYKVTGVQTCALPIYASIELRLPAGAYRAVLTQSESSANGPALADSFVFEGVGNFTAGAGADAESGFFDFFPNHRTGSWAVDIRGADTAQTPDEAVVSSASFRGSPAAP